MRTTNAPEGGCAVGVAEAALTVFAAVLCCMGLAFFAYSGKWHCLALGCVGLPFVKIWLGERKRSGKQKKARI